MWEVRFIGPWLRRRLFFIFTLLTSHLAVHQITIYQTKIFKKERKQNDKYFCKSTNNLHISLSCNEANGKKGIRPNAAV